MPDTPAAEVVITDQLVRELLCTQALSVVPDAATAPLAKAAEGWDSELWRLGDSHAVRLPRRALAAPLVLHEQQALVELSPRLEAAGLGVPSPVFHGVPGAGYPWHWSIVPWFDGTRGLDVPRGLRTAWAEHLASGLHALHVPAPADHPVNPVRGVPLRNRDDVVSARFSQLEGAELVPHAQLARGLELWRAGVAAPAWDAASVWIHGDLHPGNLIARGSDLVAVIDFGDVTAGDPAYDLAVAWLAFDAEGRAVFRRATQGRYDPATWVRAQAWAAAVSALLLSHSDDNPDYARLGRDALTELSGDPS